MHVRFLDPKIWIPVNKQDLRTGGTFRNFGEGDTHTPPASDAGAGPGFRVWVFKIY